MVGVQPVNTGTIILSFKTFEYHDFYQINDFVGKKDVYFEIE